MVCLVILLLATAWVAGFFVFLDKIPHDTPAPDQARRADAIVVLTGGGGRLELGLLLLAKQRAGKLYISGVDPGVDKATLLAGYQIDAPTLACCVALDQTAHDTSENATETAVWVRRQGFTSLHVVTANYHMPRSLLEFHAAMPDVTLTPLAVYPHNVHLEDWWHWPGTIRLLIGEYSKYLATHMRILISL